MRKDYSNAMAFAIALPSPSTGSDYLAMLKNHISRKVDWLLSQPGINQRYLTELFGLSPSAVSGWKRTGRVAREKLPVLAECSGTTSEWWLAPDAPIPPTGEWKAEGRKKQAAEFAPWPWPIQLLRRLMKLDLATRNEIRERLEFEIASAERRRVGNRANRAA